MIACIALAGLTSCKKFLETKPSDFYTPDKYYTTEAELNQALNGIYGDLMRAELYGQVMHFNLYPLPTRR